MQYYFVLLLSFAFTNSIDAFAPISSSRTTRSWSSNQLNSVEPQQSEDTPAATPSTPAVEEEEDVVMDAASKLALEKQKKVEELKAQEVFIQKSTGIHKCSNCDWEYDETKGDSFMIGGMIKPDTPFVELPSNWRCPTCRASKDSFYEVTVEIPGFEVNQGYGFGGNSLTGGQKNSLIFGGLGFFFLLFLGGYGLS